MVPSFFLISSFLVVFLTLTISIIAFLPNLLMEKKESFECGFNSITKSKTSFSTKFFLIMILFLVFDLEVAILLPSCMKEFNDMSSAIVTFIFITLLVVIMIMEWSNGIIEWSS